MPSTNAGKVIGRFSLLQNIASQNQNILHSIATQTFSIYCLGVEKHINTLPSPNILRLLDICT